MRARHLSSILIALALMACGAAASASFTLPAGLTAIEAEAFMNDDSLTGLLAIPEGVATIGENAFGGSGLYALEVPRGTVELAAQTGLSIAYAYVHSAETALAGLSNTRCIIAPSPSRAQQWAEQNDVPFIPEDALVQHGGFYYRKQDGALRLLCPVDAASIQSAVRIPAVIGGLPVNDISDFAFMGCGRLTGLTLPETLRDSPNLAGPSRIAPTICGSIT